MFVVTSIERVRIDTVAKTADGSVECPVNLLKIVAMTSPDGTASSEDETAVPIGGVRDGIRIRRRMTLIVGTSRAR